MVTTEKQPARDYEMTIPPHFMGQLRAIHYTSGKPLQAVLNAVLCRALPNPSQHPGAMLAIAYELMQPGDSLGEMMNRFQEVRDVEELEMRDDEIQIAVEAMSGTIDPLTASILDEAGSIFNGAEIDKPEPEPARDGDEWKTA